MHPQIWRAQLIVCNCFPNTSSSPVPVLSLRGQPSSMSSFTRARYCGTHIYGNSVGSSPTVAFFHQQPSSIQILATAPAMPGSSLVVISCIAAGGS